MKIGILTHHWVPNFGANLQALSTVSILKEFGHEPILINYRPAAMAEIYDRKIPEEQREVHENFLEEFIPQTERCSTASEVEQKNQKYGFDCLISGSDAVFRLDDRKNREDTKFPNPFWLNFAKEEQKKLFFSVSNMGSDFTKLIDSHKKEISKILHDSTVSVRDRWTKKELLELDGSLKIKESVDPVFLMNKYFDIPKKFKVVLDEDIILLNLRENLMSDRWIKNFVDESNSNGYKVYILPNPEGNYVGKSLADGSFDLPIHPLSWYSLMQNASGYVGVRFHPIVTALANDVPFLSIDTYQKSLFNRFTSKTYDICYKTGTQKFCRNRIGRRLMFGGRGFKLLMKQRSNDQFIKKEVSKIERIFRNLDA